MHAIFRLGEGLAARGANRVSIDSVWLHRGRRWIEDRCQPTFVANDCVEAIDYVVHNRVSIAENHA